MTVSYFNPHGKRRKFDMWVCRPSGTKLRKIKDVYDENVKFKAGAINELTFTIPALIDIDHDLVKNELVTLIRDRYMIKLNRNGEEERFIIMKIDKSMDSDGFEQITYTAFGTPIQLGNHIVKDREYVAENMRYIVRDLLKETVWNIGFMDEKFNLNDRNFEWSTSTVLQCIFEVAKKWNAIVKFDTVRSEVSFYQAKNLSMNKGIHLKKGKYLESMNMSIDPENMVTRLVAYGEDGMEFRSLSPTGSNYIEDFSWFMYPFECDANYNVIKHSNWMSDELCIAITKYQNLLKSVDGQFKQLTDIRTKTRDAQQQTKQEKSKYEADLKVQNNTIDVANATYGEDAHRHQEWQDAMLKKFELEPQIERCERDIASFDLQLEGIDKDIENFREKVSIENNFTAQEIYEWNKDYILTKEHYNDSIYDEQDLLDEAIEVFDEVREPPINSSISIEDFTRNFDESYYKDYLDLFDIVYMKSRNIDINIKAIITELSFSYDGVQVTLSNTTKVDDEWKELAKQIDIAYNTSTTVDYEKNKWKDGREAKDMVSDLLDDAFSGAKWLITGGANDTTKLNERGLISIDQFDSNVWLMIQSGQMFITPDGGNSVVVAISKNGVHAERLVGRIILGNKLHIEDTDGIVTIQNALVSIYDKSRNIRVHLGRYPDPSNPREFKYGLRVYDGAIDIRTTDGVGGIQFDKNGFRAYNRYGVKTFSVDANTGLVEIIGSISIKTSPDNYRGVVIDGNGIRGYDNSGNIRFSIDTNGNAYFSGRIQSSYGDDNNLGGKFHGKFDGVTTGTLEFVNGSFTGELVGATGRFEGLTAGTIDANTARMINIYGDQIVTKTLTADKIDVQDLSAISANLGSVHSGYIYGSTIEGGLLRGVNIETDENIKVGYSIIMSSNGGRILFGDGSWESASITGYVDINLEASLGTINLTASRIQLTALGGGVYANGKRIDI